MRVASVPVTILASLLLATGAGLAFAQGGGGGGNTAATPGSQFQPGATMNKRGTGTSTTGTTGSGLNRAPCGGVGSGNNTALGQTPRITTDTNPTTGTNQTGSSLNSRNSVGAGSGC